MIIANLILIGLQIRKLQMKADFTPLLGVPKSEKPGPFRVKKLSKLNNKFLHILLKKLFFSFPAETTGHIPPLGLRPIFERFPCRTTAMQPDLLTHMLFFFDVSVIPTGYILRAIPGISSKHLPECRDLTFESFPGPRI